MFSQSYIKECFVYEDNGDLVWRKRPISHFANESYMNRWNRRYSGKKVDNKPVSNGQVNSYIRVAINSKKIYAHRIVMIYHFGDISGMQVDHIDGNTSNNKLENLRLVTALENRKNMKLNKLNSTGVSGVSVSKNTGVYRIQLKHKNENVLNEYTDDFFEACCIRKSAEIKYAFHANHGRR